MDKEKVPLIPFQKKLKIFLSAYFNAFYILIYHYLFENFFSLYQNDLRTTCEDRFFILQFRDEANVRIINIL